LCPESLDMYVEELLTSLRSESSDSSELVAEDARKLLIDMLTQIERRSLKASEMKIIKMTVDEFMTKQQFVPDTKLKSLLDARFSFEYMPFVSRLGLVKEIPMKFKPSNNPDSEGSKLNPKRLSVQKQQHYNTKAEQGGQPMGSGGEHTLYFVCNVKRHQSTLSTSYRMYLCGTKEMDTNGNFNNFIERNPPLMLLGAKKFKSGMPAGGGPCYIWNTPDSKHWKEKTAVGKLTKTQSTYVGIPFAAPRGDSTPIIGAAPAGSLRDDDSSPSSPSSNAATTAVVAADSTTTAVASAEEAAAATSTTVDSSLVTSSSTTSHNSNSTTTTNMSSDHNNNSNINNNSSINDSNNSNNSNNSNKSANSGSNSSAVQDTIMNGAIALHVTSKGSDKLIHVVGISVNPSATQAAAATTGSNDSDTGNTAAPANLPSPPGPSRSASAAVAGLMAESSDVPADEGLADLVAAPPPPPAVPAVPTAAVPSPAVLSLTVPPPAATVVDSRNDDNDPSDKINPISSPGTTVASESALVAALNSVVQKQASEVDNCAKYTLLHSKLPRKLPASSATGVGASGGVGGGGGSGSGTGSGRRLGSGGLGSGGGGGGTGMHMLAFGKDSRVREPSRKNLVIASMQQAKDAEQAAYATGLHTSAQWVPEPDRPGLLEIGKLDEAHFAVDFYDLTPFQAFCVALAAFDQ